ncbi:MAG: hypothetical protein GX139_07820 [Armatimonadetes bacterium]|jgi:hypothetical protein|nr:hypothetical protein [Armatimonadota bacterium]
MRLKNFSKIAVCAIVVATLLGLTVTMAIADPMMYDPTPDENDVFYPYWNRGLPATATYFWNAWAIRDGENSNNVSADQVIGDVSGQALFTLGEAGAGFIEGGDWTQDAYGSATNFWDIGPGGMITLALNDPIAVGKPMDIWIQVKYHVGMAGVPTINLRTLSGEGVYESTPALIDSDWYYNSFVESTGVYGGVETGWMVYQTLWRLETGQVLVGIDVSSDERGAIIDQIVVDTQIVPEPACVVLAILGTSGLVMLRRARRLLNR